MTFTPVAHPPTEPLRVLPAPPPWKHTFISLSVRNYRLFAVANLVAMSAMWMQRVAQDWLVLELSGDVAAVGVAVALQFLPVLVFGMVAGVVVDRFPRKTLLMLCQSVAAFTSGALALLTLTGTIQVWMVYAAAVLLGLATVIDSPSRQVFANDLVGAHHLRNAISLNSSAFQLGGFLGPMAAAAVLVSVGSGWAFAVNGLVCVLTVTQLARIRSSELHLSSRSPAGKGALREGLRYIAKKPSIRWSLIVLGILCLFAQNLPVHLAGFANTRFDAGAGAYGLFNAMVAAGAFAAAILSTRRRIVRLRTVVVSATVYGTLVAAVSLAPSEVSFAAGLLLVGFGWLTFITAANYLVQSSANAAIRGRVMAVYMFLIFGGQAIAGPCVGWAIERFGAQPTMFVCGAIAAVSCGVIGLILAHKHRLRPAVVLRGRVLPWFEILG